METKLEKDVRFLKIYAVAATLVIAVLLLTAFNVSKNKKFDEIDVERINVVAKDGSLRMVISNSERQHPGISGGKIIQRTEPRPPGIIFFCENGDECGGLVYTATKTGDKIDAYGGLTFDQFKQDETLKLAYSQENGNRFAGLMIQDRPDIEEPEYSVLFDKARKLPPGPDRDAAMKPLLAPMRAFFGKTEKDEPVVVLNDRMGRMRIAMSVDASGQPKLAFYDEKGKVIQSFPSVN